MYFRVGKGESKRGRERVRLFELISYISNRNAIMAPFNKPYLKCSSESSLNHADKRKRGVREREKTKVLTSHKCQFKHCQCGQFSFGHPPSDQSTKYHSLSLSLELIHSLSNCTENFSRTKKKKK